MALEYNRLTLDANNLAQMHERESGIKAPTSIHGYQDHPSTIETMQPLFALLHRVFKVDRLITNGREGWGPLCSTLPKYFSKSTVIQN
jgi:hypothetical protein